MKIDISEEELHTLRWALRSMMKQCRDSAKQHRKQNNIDQVEIDQQAEVVLSGIYERLYLERVKDELGRLKFGMK